MTSEEEIIETAAGPARLLRSNRRTLAISVLPNGRLELAAPRKATLDAILEKVTKRSAWIRKQQRVFAEMNSKRAARRYCSGSTHRYLGRQYRLKVRVGETSSVKLYGGYFRVTTPQDDSSKVEQLLEAWMIDRAREQFSKRIEPWEAWCRRHRLPLPRLLLRKMRKRWGSAHRDGRIALNPELVRAAPICIEYVIVHEVCHLKYPSHGPEFFRLLGQFMPSWRSAKARLERAEL